MNIVFQFLLFWFASIILTYGLSFSLIIKMFKDIADTGYLIDLKILSKVSDKMHDIKSKNNSISLEKNNDILFDDIKQLIPLYNIMDIFYNAALYLKCKNELLNELSVLGCLKEMNEAERYYYNKKKGGIRALVLPFIIEIKCITAMKYTNDDKNNIFYIKKDNNIIILKATGEYELKSDLELKRIITTKKQEKEKIEILDDIGLGEKYKKIENEMKNSNTNVITNSEHKNKVKIKTKNRKL